LHLSRAARRVVNEVIVPVMSFYDFEWKQICPLHPSNDKMLPLIRDAQYVRRNRWRCEICNKVFTSQEYIDFHMENKHADLMLTNATVCMADLCEILGCERFNVPSESDSYSDNEVIRVPCSSAAMERRKFHCEQIMNSCFPKDGNSNEQKLNELFVKEFCFPLNCDSFLSLQDTNDIVKKHSSRWTVGSVFNAFSLVVILLSLGVFYLVVIVRRREMKLNDDLRYLSQRRQRSRLYLLKQATKTKGY